MNRHRVIGAVTIVFAALPIAVVVGLVAGRDFPVTHGFVLYRAALAAGLLVAGICLIWASPRAARVVASVVWAAVILDAAWGVVLLWPHWVGLAPNFVYLGVGAVVLALLLRERRKAANGGEVAV